MAANPSIVTDIDKQLLSHNLVMTVVMSDCCKLASAPSVKQYARGMHIRIFAYTAWVVYVDASFLRCVCRVACVRLETVLKPQEELTVDQ